jgi:hypothetical protein
LKRPVDPSRRKAAPAGWNREPCENFQERGGVNFVTL